MNVIQRLPVALFNLVKTSVTGIRKSSSSQPAEYITTNLANGVGRYMCQLHRITFKFCKEHPSSSGLRSEFQQFRFHLI